MLKINNNKQLWIDTSELKGNEYLPVEKIEETTGILRTNSAYGLMMLGIISDANAALEDSPLTVCQHQHGIKVLDDSGSAVYHNDLVRRSILKMGRSTRKLKNIDPNKLEKEHRRQHEKNLINNSRIVQAVKKADREQLG